MGLDVLNKYQSLSRPDDSPDPTAIISNNFPGIGERIEIPLRDLVNRFKTNMKFRLTIMTNVAFSVGPGFYNTADETTPTGRQMLEVVNDFAEEWDLDTLNQKIARDVWMSGNAFLNAVPAAGKAIAAIYMLPLSGFTTIKRTEGGDPIKYIQQWGNRPYKEYEPQGILHWPWLAIDEAPFGEGQGQIFERHGIGYKTANGFTVRKPSMFETMEKLEHAAGEMIYAGLPRYLGYFEGTGATKEFVDSTNAKFNKLDPLEHLFTNVKADVKTISLDTDQRFDSFFRYIDDQFVAGTMSPLIRLWSSLNFTYASSKEAVAAMMPLIAMYQRAHKRFVERMIYRPLVLQEGKDNKKAKVRLNWGQQEKRTIEEIAQIFNILKDPAMSEKFNPDDIIGMLEETGANLTEPVKQDTKVELEHLRNLIGLADKGKTVKLTLPPVPQGSKIQADMHKLTQHLLKKYAV